MNSLSADKLGRGILVSGHRSAEERVSGIMVEVHEYEREIAVKERTVHRSLFFVNTRIIFVANAHVSTRGVRK